METLIKFPRALASRGMPGLNESDLNPDVVRSV